MLKTPAKAYQSPNSKPFSSPAIQQRKEDGALDCRLVRELSKHTMMAKFSYYHLSRNKKPFSELF